MRQLILFIGLLAGCLQPTSEDCDVFDTWLQMDNLSKEYEGVAELQNGNCILLRSDGLVEIDSVDYGLLGPWDYTEPAKNVFILDDSFTLTITDAYIWGFDATVTHIPLSVSFNLFADGCE